MDWIEDDGRRHDLFKERLPGDVRLVWAKNAGTGLGILGRLSPGDYAGILFDHGLEKRAVTQDGARFNGSHVAEALLGQSAAERDIPILVHSMNVKCGQEMAQRLEDASYPVTRILLSDLSRERFLEWLEEVREELAADRRSLARIRAFSFLACAAGAPAFVVRAFGSGLVAFVAQLVGALSAVWIVLEFLDGTPLDYDDDWQLSYAVFGITLAVYLTLTFVQLAHGAG
ncbi:MAG: hypothetical protein ACOX6T_27010 [Myxococcales bacterium]|jgi:hypothetical protein